MDATLDGLPYFIFSEVQFYQVEQLERDAI